MTRNRLLILILAIVGLAIAAQPASAGVQIVPTHTHDDAACNVEAWSWTACAHVTNDTKVITAPGVTGSGTFNFLTHTGNACADLFDVSRTIPADATRIFQVGGSFGTGCSNGTFFFDLDIPGHAPPVTAAVHIGKRTNDAGDGVDELNECVRQPYVWCEHTRTWDSGRDTQAAFRLTTRPLLVQIVNETPNPIKRVPWGVTTRSLLRSGIGDSAYWEIPPGGSAWMGGLRKTGPTSCPTDPATGQPEATCVSTTLGRSSLGAVFRIQPATAVTSADYAGGEVSFTIRSRTDGARNSTCVPMYRPTLPPLTCTVEFGGTSDGVLTATVTITASAA